MVRHSLADPALTSIMKMPFFTTTAGAIAAAQAIGAIKAGELDVRPIRDYAH